ncbi:hypothetical protein LOCC1_G008648 [Lachnellula occidentalis]|uniref:INO80 complex subunit B-like conserved region domain-containing protein n=1 Tax=Lachnellula occidentalis TaxID=215460 RepID=A0A8H8RET3_9HELO|nr:hypothetical protein LOCC1_G008648 [Lachnellula occidentalis]
MSGRADRASKKQRRLSTDSEGTEEGYDWAGLKGGPSKAGKAPEKSKSKSNRDLKCCVTTHEWVEKSSALRTARGYNIEPVEWLATRLREAKQGAGNSLDVLPCTRLPHLLLPASRHDRIESQLIEATTRTSTYLRPSPSLIFQPQIFLTHFPSIMPARRSQRKSSSATKAKEAIANIIIDRPSRPSRKAAETSSAVVSRAPPGSSTRGLSLTVKTSANKLREATRSSPLNQSVTVSSRESFTGGEILEGKRSRNARKSYVLESDSDEDEEMEDVNDEDAAADSLEDDEDMDAEDDGLGDDDADGDVDMEIPPPPPTIKISKAQSGKQTITAKPSSKPDNKTVEQKEVELGSDDEELSELESDLEEEVEEEGMQTGNEEDAEGEEEEIEIEEEAEEEDELESDLETPGGGSRASTPDLNKLTKRQRARLEEGGSGHLLALPDGKALDPLSYDILTNRRGPSKEALDGRRARHAPCRNGSPKKELEREAQRGRKGTHTSQAHILNNTNMPQMETINKLLKKQAPKTNARRKDLNGEFSAEGELLKPKPQFVRWVSNKDGNRIGVPEEWVAAPIGSMFQNSVKGVGMGGKLIEEVS